MVGVDLEFENPVSVSSVGPVGPITVAGIPDPINISILELPKILLGSDPETPLAIAPVTLTLKPIDLNLSIKEIPSMRTHLPADFCVGLSVLGVDLLAVKLCGEAQIINEPYQPNPCEVCGHAHRDVPGTAAVMRLEEQ